MNKISFRDKWISKMKRWPTGAILNAVTSYAEFQANPEGAFGVVRKLNTMNKLRTEHVLQFLEKHPVWGQLKGAFAYDESNNGFFNLVAKSGWGIKNQVHATYQKSGLATIIWETKRGQRTETIELSMEMVGYGTDSRMFMSMTMGGSMIRARLMKDGTNANMARNNDHDGKRFVLYGDRLVTARAEYELIKQEKVRKEERAESLRVNDFMSRLMSGETVNLGQF